jgi:hypothetical protein
VILSATRLPCATRPPLPAQFAAKPSGSVTMLLSSTTTPANRSSSGTATGSARTTCAIAARRTRSDVAAARASKRWAKPSALTGPQFGRHLRQLAQGCRGVAQPPGTSVCTNVAPLHRRTRRMNPHARATASTTSVNTTGSAAATCVRLVIREPPGERRRQYPERAGAGSRCHPVTKR